MEEIIQRYRQFSEAERAVNVPDPHAPLQNRKNPSQGQSESSARYNAELMEIAQRYLDETNVNKLSMTELAEVEKELDAAVRETMSKKANLMMDMISKLQKKGKMLQEERRLLEMALEKEENAGRSNENSKGDLPSTSECPAVGDLNTSEDMWWQPLQNFPVSDT